MKFFLKPEMLLVAQRWVVKSVHGQLLSIDCSMLYACRVLFICENYQFIAKPVPREILVNDWLKKVSKQDRILHSRDLRAS